MTQALPRAYLRRLPSASNFGLRWGRIMIERLITRICTLAFAFFVCSEVILPLMRFTGETMDALAAGLSTITPR
jgi:hypothetical protein